MYWKALLRLQLAMIILALVAACGQQQKLGPGSTGALAAQGIHFGAETTMGKLNKAGTIRVGIKFDQPLFGQQDLGNKLSGFEPEIARIITEALGIPTDKIKWVEAPAAQREELIKQDKVDMVVATYTINEKRRQQVSFAGPYYIAGQSLMTRSNNNTITGPDSLRSTGARVCSTQGSTSAEKIRQYIDSTQLTMFDVQSKCADALRTGQVDAVTTDNAILLGFVASSNGIFKLVGDTFSKEPYGIGIRKGDTMFCKFINDTLIKAAESGAYSNAWEKTAGKVVKQTPQLPVPDNCI